MAAEEAGAVARRVALLREPLAERRLRLHDHLLAAAVKEQVIILRRECEVGARVEAERPRRPEVVPVLAVPHEGIRHQNMRVGVADILDRIPPGRRPEQQLAGDARNNVPVVRTAATIINSQRVLNRDVSTPFSAEIFLGFRELQKWE